MSYLICFISVFLCLALTILSLYLINRQEKLESEINEKQTLIKASRHSLAEAEEKILQRNDLLGYQESKIRKLAERLEKQESYILSNDYGSAEIRLNKLKELVHDYQSKN